MSTRSFLKVSITFVVMIYGDILEICDLDEDIAEWAGWCVFTFVISDLVLSGIYSLTQSVIQERVHPCPSYTWYQYHNT